MKKNDTSLENMENAAFRRGVRGIVRSDFSSFMARVLHTVDPGAVYMPGWHLGLMCEYLEQVRQGNIQRLLINMPPRMMKSIVTSVAWPAWLLGHDPTVRILAASYSERLALKHAQDCRLVLQSGWYRRIFPGTRIAEGENEKHKFVTTRRGYRLATSVGGTVTGEGGGFLILDDPHNPAQALSHSQRNQGIEWFRHTFLSRLDDKRRGGVVVVMQRLHPEDLSHMLLAEKGRWEHCCLPALADMRLVHQIGALRKIRRSGESLHPGREPPALLRQIRDELGSAVFAAQYQQNPQPLEGGVFKPEWVRRYLPGEDAQMQEGRRIQSWDTAIKTAAHHDYSVCVTLYENTEGWQVHEVWRQRVAYPELRRAVVAQTEKWQPEAVLIEDAAAGQSLLQELRESTRLPLIAVRPVQDKITRAASVSALVEAGKLFLPSAHSSRGEGGGNDWLAIFEEELFSFPHTAHDDQVDALVQALRWATRREVFKPAIRML